MSRARIFAFAGAAALLSTSALAADLIPPPPLPPPLAAPVPVAINSGWYFRGYIGASNEFLTELTNPAFLTAPQFTFLDKGGFEAAPFGGGGIGYQWNNWFRVDATFEYRGAATFHALDTWFNAGQGQNNTNNYTATKSELVGLINGYLDLGTWACVTPFIGAGVGFANIRLDHFRDLNVEAGGGGWAQPSTQTNFAWALTAGLAYKVTPNFAVELSYRYLNVGSAATGILINDSPQSPNEPPMTFNKIQSHDIMLGVRWMLQPEAPAPLYPPLIRKG